mmetsp:Transcript_3805/g.8717  ORF Transcript_3805/g.8717 Transcript_3805/m.8717 type:complete len:271 (+) Transcript_3805:427-1239(+)
MTFPTKSLGQMIVARTVGSSTSCLFATLSQSAGDSTSLSSLASPSRIRSGTNGFVAITDWRNSSSSRCRKTSMCRRPRKPHRKPGPRAWLVSRCTSTLESFKVSFSTAFFKDSYSSLALGKIPPKHIDLACLNPASGSTGTPLVCSVSPIRMLGAFDLPPPPPPPFNPPPPPPEALFVVLRPVTKYPIWPASKVPTLWGSGHIKPSSRTSRWLPVPTEETLSPSRTLPSNTRTRQTTPRNVSWCASKIRALNGADASASAASASAASASP